MLVAVLHDGGRASRGLGGDLAGVEGGVAEAEDAGAVAVAEEGGRLDGGIAGREGRAVVEVDAGREAVGGRGREAQAAGTVDVERREGVRLVGRVTPGVDAADVARAAVEHRDRGGA